jgi:hypothetical protein
MVVVLAEAETLFFSVEPLDVNWPGCPRYDCALQLLNCFLRVGERCELNEGRSSKAVVFSDELNV